VKRVIRKPVKVDRVACPWLIRKFNDSKLLPATSELSLLAPLRA
jgi:hypothetical protein